MTTTTWRLAPTGPDQAWNDAFAARGPGIGDFGAMTDWKVLSLSAHRLRASPGDQQGKGLMPYLLRQGLVV